MHSSLLRLACFRAGYNQTEQEAICAQWQYQPSEKYVPSQPRTSS
ncbi:hypothetical protein KR038_002044 [Drosophila bunnanda]|nr:hypothetical protein KR038_002044 [Drosophila bunnanda]